ncbi:MAG: amino acid adenylation domain-containing protein [Deltaproteobacteria bacterium]|nr:amino acid adenylation domain-containing protein [Deltaproteobacteria bacterium]
MSRLLHNVFENAVLQFADKTAIVEENGHTISYDELEKMANKYANIFLKRKSSRQLSPYVGILSNVHIHSIAAVFGALKSGLAYVPLDESSPGERLQKIIDNTGLDVIALDPRFYEKHRELIEANKKILFVLLHPHPCTPAADHIDFSTVLLTRIEERTPSNQVSDDLAYILHSSGSTGVPKGIMLSHRNARTFVDWMQKTFQLTSDDVVMSRAPFKFDLSVFDIFNTLGAGATLVCFDWFSKRDNKHAAYVDLMIREKATTLYTTPSTLISLMNRGNLGREGLNLKKVMYAGEPFPTPFLRRFMNTIPGVPVANIYGPTETNIITCQWIRKPPKNDEPIPLGKEVDDTEIIVVSENSEQLCDIGETGELWCRGGTVTLGYLGMEEQTKKHLVKSPFHKSPAYFWRTGDFGYRDSNGILHYCGRRDHMVKVKGFRIEIGEVESALAKDNNLDKACVVAIPDSKYGNRLYCFYTSLNGASYNEEDVEKNLFQHLPAYMMPYRYIQKREMPMSSAGKIDRILLQKEILNREGV